MRPVYYGLQLFAEAAPPASRLLRVRGVGGGSSVLSVWATRATDGIDRVLLIDKDPARAETVTLRPPAGTPAGATLERMRAPSVYARSDVTLGGRSYGPNTTTGQLAPAITRTLTPNAHGNYVIRVPAGSAALVALRPSPAAR